MSDTFGAPRARPAKLRCHGHASLLSESVDDGYLCPVADLPSDLYPAPKQTVIALAMPVTGGIAGYREEAHRITRLQSLAHSTDFIDQWFR